MPARFLSACCAFAAAGLSWLLPVQYILVAGIAVAVIITGVFLLILGGRGKHISPMEMNMLTICLREDS